MDPAVTSANVLTSCYKSLTICGRTNPTTDSAKKPRLILQNHSRPEDGQTGDKLSKIQTSYDEVTHPLRTDKHDNKFSKINGTHMLRSLTGSSRTQIRRKNCSPSSRCGSNLILLSSILMRYHRH